MLLNGVELNQQKSHVAVVKNIMELRFGFISGTEKTQKEVADMLGISQSYISRLEKKIAAITAPDKLPKPPSTTKIKISNDFKKPNAVG